MRIVNGVVFITIGICLIMIYFHGNTRRRKENKWILYIKNHLHLLILLFVANAISLALTYSEKETEVFIEKGKYGEEEKQIPFLLQKEEDITEIFLEVDARKLTEKQLKEKVANAFLYLEENMKGENASLAEVRKSLNYSFDFEQFPFDVEFVSEDYALIDGEGHVKNDIADLLSLGYTKEEIEKGIPVNVAVTLWYEEESYEQIFPVVVFAKEKSILEEQFAKVVETIKKVEKEASYEEGFYIPTKIDGIQVTRSDIGGITPLQVLIAGVILVGLLALREQENRRREEQNRMESLVRSYPWFINEMVLLLGAGMQVRNIFKILVKDFEGKKMNEDYRKPLIVELDVAIRAMELGMTEEQAYYQLGRRLKLPCYIKLMTLLEQNVKRGARGLIAIFEQEELSALEERKNLAKRYGEEAGTKLLGPMILLLLVIMFMIMIPSFMGFM